MNLHLPPELLPLLAERLGWALLHSVWQGALAAAALALTLPFLRSASARHAVCLLVLLGLAATVAATFALARSAQPFSGVSTATLATAHVAEAPRSSAAVPLATPSNDLPPTLAAASPERRSWRERFEPMVPRLSWAWSIGVALLTLRQLLGWQRIRAIRRTGVEARPELQRTFARLLETFGCTVATRLLESAHVTVPMLAGLVKPAVLLPLRVVTGLRPCEIEAILAHELAHLVRRDAWSNLAQVAIETLFFYHPAVWWIGRRARQEREMAADDLALSVCTDRRVYAGALAQLAELECASPTAVAATGGSLLARIQRIVRPERIESPASGWSLCLPPLLAALALALTTIFRAEAEPPKPAATAEQDAAKSEALAKPGASDKFKESLQGAIVVIESSAATSSAKSEPSREADGTSQREGGAEFGDTALASIQSEIAKLKAELAKPGLAADRRVSNERLLARLEAGLVGIKAGTSFQRERLALDPATERGRTADRDWYPQDARVAESIWSDIEALKASIDAGKADYAALKADERSDLLEAKLVRAQRLLEKLVEGFSSTGLLPEFNRQAARRRAVKDAAIYSATERAEIESIYQVANENWRTPEARESLKKLLEKYDRANRTGCATLYLGQMSEGQERLDFLTRAVEKFSDCYYLDGCQVGGYGRYVLAIALWEKGEKEKARALLAELRTKYAGTTDHRGQPLTTATDALENQWAAEK